MTDSGEKNLKFRDAPPTFKSDVLTHFGFYNISQTKFLFSCM